MLDRLVQDRIARSDKSHLLLGPRQVGKSTLCRALGPQVTVNLVDEAEFLRYSKQPSRLSQELETIDEPTLILVDEVQRVPAILNVVQSLLDRPDNRLRFLLTGSSARKLKRGGANLLPGRVILEHLDPLTCPELPGAVDLERALQLGMLPGIHLGGAESIDVLGTYAEVYLREEIRAEALSKSIGDFARFLDVAALVSGQWLNYSKIASDVEIPKETIRRFVSLLEDTLLAFRIPPFQPRRKISRRVSQRDKLVLFDVGVRNALLGLHRRPLPPTEIGSVFEQWFVLQVLYLNRALRKDWKVTAYRTEAGAEVDLVVERDDDIVGIEIKATPNVTSSDARGLHSLAEVVKGYLPLKKRIACRTDKRRRLSPDVDAMSYAELLDELSAGE